MSPLCRFCLFVYCWPPPQSLQYPNCPQTTPLITPFYHSKTISLSLFDSPEVGEPFHQLGSVVLVEPNVREVHLQHGRTGVAHPEEHQLRLAQVHRS